MSWRLKLTIEHLSNDVSLRYRQHAIVTSPQGREEEGKGRRGRGGYGKKEVMQGQRGEKGDVNGEWEETGEEGRGGKAYDA